jgi:parallel beta-helix repeat protein
MRRIRIAMTIALLGICPIASADIALNQSDCGRELVKGAYVLVEDMTCDGDGLIVIEKNVRIDLAGHTIAGPLSAPGAGVSDGIVIRADNAHIEGNGGTIRDFSNGVRIGDASATPVSGNRGPSNNNKINGVTLTSNRHDASNDNNNGVLIDAGSANNKVTNCAADNNHRGVLIRRSEGNMVKDSTLDQNDIGVGVCCGSSRNQILQNSITNSTNNVQGGGIGILLFGALDGATNNLIQGNTVNNNEFVGIWSGCPGCTNPADNQPQSNNILVNTAEGHPYDVVDENSRQCTNLWANNTYDTAASGGACSL